MVFSRKLICRLESVFIVLQLVSAIDRLGHHGALFDVSLFFLFVFFCDDFYSCALL